LCFVKGNFIYKDWCSNICIWVSWDNHENDQFVKKENDNDQYTTCSFFSHMHPILLDIWLQCLGARGLPILGCYLKVETFHQGIEGFGEGKN
jgi:hypothetical protein